MKKKVFYSELSYVFGLLSLAVGSSMMTVANFGLSMVIAPAYIVHLKLSELWSFVTFGMAEYIFQALLLVVMIVAVRKFKATYLLSFATAVIYGFFLDGFLTIMSLLGDVGITARIILYIIGLFLTALGVSFMFHTYISAEVYELFVKEVAQRYNIKITTIKIIYDYVSCIISVVMSFWFFGLWQLKGIGFGTVICALINGKLIGIISKYLDNHFEFVDRLKLRKYF